MKKSQLDRLMGVTSAAERFRLELNDAPIPRKILLLLLQADMMISQGKSLSWRRESK